MHALTSMMLIGPHTIPATPIKATAHCHHEKQKLPGHQEASIRPWTRRMVHCVFPATVTHPWKMTIPTGRLILMIPSQPRTWPTTVMIKTNCQSKHLRHPNHQISTTQTLDTTHRWTLKQIAMIQLKSWILNQAAMLANQPHQRIGMLATFHPTHVFK